MKKTLSYFIGVVILFVLVVVFSTERLFDSILDKNSVQAHCVKSQVYQKTIPLLSSMILENPSVTSLQRSKLAFSADEIQTILMETFPEDWFYTVFFTFYEDLIYGNGSGKLPLIILSDKKNLFRENLIRSIEDKIDQLPEASFFETLAMAKNVSKQGVAAIRYKLPKQLESQWKPLIRQQVSQFLVSFPDTLDIIKYANSPDIKISISRYGEAGEFAHNFRYMGYGSIIFGFMVIAGLNWSDRKKLLFRIGMPITAAFATISAIAYLAGEKIKQSNAIQWSEENQKWIPVFSDCFLAILQESLNNMVLLSVFGIVVGLLLMFTSRYVHHDEPL